MNNLPEIVHTFKKENTIKVEEMEDRMRKRLVSYTLCFVGLCTMFTLCYYYSYQKALKQMQSKSEEDNYALIQQLTQIGTTKSTDLDTLNPPATSVNVAGYDVVQAGAKLRIENYKLPENELTVEERMVTSDLAGLTREEIIKQLSDYMQDIPVTEYEKGLFAYELIKFSQDELILRKSYNQDLVDFKYYVAVKDGYVIIYYSDLKTVYEYTEIIAIDLPESERNRLMQGIKIKTNEELYELLESYTS